MKTVIDHVAAHELALYATNDSRLYHRHSIPIIANLAKKMRKGQYDPEKAAKLWLYLLVKQSIYQCIQNDSSGILASVRDIPKIRMFAS